jgi:protein-S-isoprenylcysteine O-methyltransferase Ste14
MHEVESMNIILRWSTKEQPLLVRVIAMVFAGILFIFLIPYALIIAIPKLDALLHLPSFFFGLANLLVGGIMLLSGLFFAWWSIGMQLFKANGTPLPMIPTQKLLVSGPFRYCRNPMTFGTICAYGGVALAVGSLASLFTVALFGGLLIVYLKRIEEHELAARFGQDYLNYKAKTPFMIPRLMKRN